MKIREWLEEHMAFTTIAAVLVLGFSIVMLWSVLQGATVKPVVHGEYFYDLGSSSRDPLDRLFVARSDRQPPIESPSKVIMPDGTQAGVRAYVFTCGECSDRSTLFIGYLETVPPPIPGARIPSSGRTVRTLDDSNWSPVSTPQGQKTILSPQTRCESEVRLKACQPDLLSK